MTSVRKIDVEIEPETYPAIERTLIDAIAAGESPPTILQWTFQDELFLELGPVEDAALINRERAAHHGVEFCRRYNVSGGTGFFKEDYTPVLYAFFPDQGEYSMTEYIDLAGKAVASALRDVGVERATYRDGGDIELVPEGTDEQLLKLGVSGAGYQSGVWGVFANIIHRSYAPEEFEIIDDILKLPKEKFEDKDTDSVAGRMTSLEEVAPGVDIWTVLDEAATNLASHAGGDPEPGEFSNAEQEKIANHSEYFGSEEWFSRYSTQRILSEADPEDRVAEVAYKGRKLIKLSVRVDGADVVDDIEFTGDMYHRPGFKAIDRINESVRGTSIHDKDALHAAIADVYDTEGVEIPWLSPDDFVTPILRAQDSLVPAREFDRS